MTARQVLLLYLLLVVKEAIQPTVSSALLSADTISAEACFHCGCLNQQSIATSQRRF